MDTEFINRIKGYAALFMAVMAGNLLIPMNGYSCEREYPDVILDTRFISQRSAEITSEYLPSSFFLASRVSVPL